MASKQSPFKAADSPFSSGPLGTRAGFWRSRCPKNAWSSRAPSLRESGSMKRPWPKYKSSCSVWPSIWPPWRLKMAWIRRGMLKESRDSKFFFLFNMFFGNFRCSCSYFICLFFSSKSCAELSCELLAPCLHRGSWPATGLSSPEICQYHARSPLQSECHAGSPRGAMRCQVDIMKNFCASWNARQSVGRYAR